MAILVIESFDHFNTSQFMKKWNAQIPGVGVSSTFIAPTISTSAARKGNGLLTLRGGSAWRSFADTTTFAAGFAFRPMDIVNKRIVAFRDEGSIQLYLQLSTNGRVQIFRGNGALLGNSAHTLSGAKFVHIELQTTISSTIGAVTLRINGSVDLGFTGSNVNTQVSSQNRVNIIQFGDPTISNVPFHYDDVWVTDGAMLGPQFVDVIRPNGGALRYMDMSIVGAGSHYQTLDDTTPDDDTTYVLSSAINRGTVLSEFEDIRQPLPSYMPASSGAIAAIAVHTYARKEYGNTRAFKTGIYPGTQDGAPGSIAYFDNDPLYIETDYAYHSDYYSTNPGSGGTWSIRAINDLKAGFARVI